MRPWGPTAQQAWAEWPPMALNDPSSKGVQLWLLSRETSEPFGPVVIHTPGSCKKTTEER